MLAGAACAEFGRKPEFPQYKAWIIGALVGVAADFPSAVRLLLGITAADHGLYSHSLLAAVFAFGAGTVLGGIRWGAVFGSAYGSHLLIDLLRESGNTGVYLLSPVSMRPEPPIAPLIPHVPFDVYHGGTIFSLHGNQPYLGFSIQLGIGIVILGAAIVIRHRRERKRKEYIKALVKQTPSRRTRSRRL